MLKIRKSIVFIIILSFFIGGISGAIFGALSSNFFLNSLISEKNQGIVLDKDIIKTEESSATIEVVKKVSPAVVNIVISKDLQEYYSSTGPDIFPFFDIFDFNFPFNFHSPQLGEEGSQAIGWGTGFIISSDGLILTNKHVVVDEEAEYTVVTNTEEKYPAKVLARHPINDIAILKIEAEDLSLVDLGDSNNLEIGETVIAIGNALGEYKNTVTKGVISGIGRNIVAGTSFGRTETLDGVIQTDAAINPGNSGGPLLNLRGEVIGINTAISREGLLIGFAIPINLAKDTIESVQKYGRIRMPFLGVRYIIINKEIAQANRLEVDYGALIVKGNTPEEVAISPGSPADKANIVENDIILEINGQKITTENTLAKEIIKYQPEEEIELKILHKGEERIVKVILTEWLNK